VLIDHQQFSDVAEKPHDAQRVVNKSERSV